MALLLSPLLEKPILLFGGKGGVGKTTLAAAAALHCAAAGQRTLLVSTDPAHSAGDALEAELGGEPREVRPRLWALEIDPETEADRHIDEVKRHLHEVAAPRLLAEVEREIDVARVSPGAAEAALFERLAALVPLADVEYDRMIFDTAPTGHTLRLLSLPELLSVWIDSLVRRRRATTALGRAWRHLAGAAATRDRAADPVLAALERRRDRFRAARARLTDLAVTSFLFVVTPERLPVLETARAIKALERHRIPVGGVLVNRVRAPAPPDDASVAATARRDRQDEWLREIERRFGRYPVLHFPEDDDEVRGDEALRRLLGE